MPVLVAKILDFDMAGRPLRLFSQNSIHALAEPDWAPRAHCSIGDYQFAGCVTRRNAAAATPALALIHSG